MTFAYLALLMVVGIERLAELVISRRNHKKLAAQGARAIPEPHFRWIVFLHVAVLIGAGVEVLFLHRPLIPALAIPMLVLFVLSNVLRWWVIRVLADLWVVQIMDSTNVKVVSNGPFRWVRHPNYVGVILEVFSLPMIHTAWITAIGGVLGYILPLRRRLKLEDAYLMANPAYRLAMGGKPRFLPRLFKRRPDLPGAERAA